MEFIKIVCKCDKNNTKIIPKVGKVEVCILHKSGHMQNICKKLQWISITHWKKITISLRNKENSGDIGL